MDKGLKSSAFRVYCDATNHLEIVLRRNNLRVICNDAIYYFRSWQQAEIFHKMLGEYVAEFKEMEINKTIKT